MRITLHKGTNGHVAPSPERWIHSQILPRVAYGCTSPIYTYLSCEHLADGSLWVEVIITIQNVNGLCCERSGGHDAVSFNCTVCSIKQKEEMTLGRPWRVVMSPCFARPGETNGGRAPNRILPIWNAGFGRWMQATISRQRMPLMCSVLVTLIRPLHLLAPVLRLRD